MQVNIGVSCMQPCKDRLWQPCLVCACNTVLVNHPGPTMDNATFEREYACARLLPRCVPPLHARTRVHMHEQACVLCEQ